MDLNTESDKRDESKRKVDDDFKLKQLKAAKSECSMPARSDARLSDVVCLLLNCAVLYSKHAYRAINNKCDLSESHIEDSLCTGSLLSAASDCRLLLFLLERNNRIPNR